MSIHPAALDPVASRVTPRRHAWTVFAVLFALMVVDYVDRQVVVSMFPHLKAQWDLSDRQLGSLVSIVSIAVAAGAVPISLAADRWGRARSIVAMVLVWSAATLACAFATSYGELLGARAAVGLGEAAYGTVGAALIATLFPQRMRSSVLGAFFFAAVIGSVGGVMAGGFIAERWGWQAGFGAAAFPGMVLAIVFFLVARDPQSPSLSAAGSETRGAPVPLRGIVAELLRPRTALFATVGTGFNMLVLSAMYAWLPSYFNRYYGLAPDAAGARTALIVLASGLGAFLCSIAADRMTPRLPNARLVVPATAAVLTTLFLGVAFAAMEPGGAQFMLIVLGAFVMAASLGPADAVVIDVVDPSLRATAASIISLTRNLFGLAGGPLLAGALSDAVSLQFALAIVPLFCLAASAFFMVATLSYERDLRAARDAQWRERS
jgi:predicted MFS family arabinose efflux permease